MGASGLKKSTWNIEKFFDSILDVFSDGIYISDHTGKTLKVNSMYEKLTGLKQEELIGRFVMDLVKEGKYDVALNPEIVKTGEPKTVVQITKLGRKVILNGYPVFDNAGNVALVVTFVRDVTLLSQLKEQLAAQQEQINKYHQGVQYLAKKNPHNSSLVFESKDMQDLMGLLLKVAQTDATILLLGETGVGKDVLARKVHENSPRSLEPYFKVDCTTIPENLIESELFGYEPGAFSGASTKGKPGFIEMADKGTLFLDEIGELSLTMQTKLLRVLQDQEIMRIGSTRLKKVDVRIIAATNRNLEEAVKEGTFRADLFYRLRVAVLKIPPLRDRKADILPLAKNFLDKFNTRYKKKMALSPEVERIFSSYKWPGNIREMENLIQSLVVTREKEYVGITDLPNNMHYDQDDKTKILIPSVVNVENKSLAEIMEEIEIDLLRKAISLHGSITEVARIFKVDRTTIFRKIKKYSL